MLFEENEFPFSKLHTYFSSTYDFLDNGLSPYVINHLQNQSTPHIQVSNHPSLAPAQSPGQPRSPNHATPSSPQPSQPTSSPPQSAQSTSTNTESSSSTLGQSDLNPHLDHTQHLPLPPIFQPISSSKNKPITRSQHGIFRPNKKYQHGFLTNVTKPPLPHNPVSALQDPNWKMAMDDEYIALIKNKTWDLVPGPPDVNVIQSMWIFRHKEKSDGSFERHKARLVGNGAGQQI